MKTLAKVQERTEQLLQADKVSLLPLVSRVHGRLGVLTRHEHSLGNYNAVNQEKVNAKGEKKDLLSCKSGDSKAAFPHDCSEAASNK